MLNLNRIVAGLLLSSYAPFFLYSNTMYCDELTAREGAIAQSNFQAVGSDRERLCLNNRAIMLEKERLAQGIQD